MRTRLAALAGVGALAATTGILLAATSVSATPYCPRHTYENTYYVAGIGVVACAVGPEPGCDPQCDPTAVAPRD